jgi:hypothetical protein
MRLVNNPDPKLFCFDMLRFSIVEVKYTWSGIDGILNLAVMLRA